MVGPLSAGSEKQDMYTTQLLTQTDSSRDQIQNNGKSRIMDTHWKESFSVLIHPCLDAQDQDDAEMKN